MYETEANNRTESSQQVPTQVLKAFGELRDKISTRSLISWGEHCTECGWPSCYSTCDLYSPREDLRCRRFIDGMVRIDCPESPNGYLLKIRFKRWGMLWARSTFDLQTVDRAKRFERSDYRISTALQQIPMSTSLKRTAIQKRYALKKRFASRYARHVQRPTSFVLECYNPQAEPIRLSLRIRSLHSTHPHANLVQLIPGFRQARELTEAKVPFESLVEVAPGFHRATIPFEHIAPIVDLSAPYRIDITPNEVEDDTTLYFGVMDFIYGKETPSLKASPIKCVVWDLDNTIWDGVLVEDGYDKLRLKPGIQDIICELDRRGFLQSLASKNNQDEALQVLRKFNLDPFFLYPQISWQPKSESIKTIAQSLNISIDSFLFIDDSEFELQETKSACKDINVLDAKHYLTLLERPDFQVPVTPESESRRSMYQVEAARKIATVEFGTDYLAFLRHCEIALDISTLTENNLERVHELTQRTNQLNFSGNRYTREVLRDIESTSYLDTYVLTCHDRFGSYGIVGFSIVDRREPRMTDLMLSCRIQSKRVEHAFLTHIIRTYAANSDRQFLANYRRTSRNGPAGQVFAEIGMKELSESDGVAVWSFPKGQVPSEEGIVTINEAMDAPKCDATPCL
jgi:FkbH-like protein